MALYELTCKEMAANELRITLMWLRDCYIIKWLTARFKELRDDWHIGYASDY
jgi:hypothetical protein